MKTKNLNHYSKLVAITLALAGLSSLANAEGVGHGGGGDSQSLPYASLERIIAEAVMKNAAKIELTTPVCPQDFKSVSEKLIFVPQKEVSVDGRKRDAYTKPNPDGTFSVQLSRVRWNQGTTSGGMFTESSKTFRRVFLLVHETLVAAGQEVSDQYGYSLQVTKILQDDLTENHQGIADRYDEVGFLRPNKENLFRSLLVQKQRIVCSDGKDSHSFGLAFSWRKWTKELTSGGVVEYQIDNQTFHSSFTPMAFKRGQAGDAGDFYDNWGFKPGPEMRVDYDATLRPMLVIEPKLVGGNFSRLSSYDGSVWTDESENDCILL